jgi:hypothetical protein
MRYPPLPEEVAREGARTPRRRGRPRPPRTPEQRARDQVYNVLALLFALGTIVVLAAVIFLWGNYNSPLNPLAPPTPLPIVITATYTPTYTPTPTPTLTPSQTFTPSPVPTLAPSATFTPIFLEGFTTPDALTPGAPAANGTPGAAFPFVLQRGVVLYLTNPSGRGGCRWSSIAGAVVTFEGAAVNGYSVRVVGEGIDQTVASGSAPGMGSGGFEVQVGAEARVGTYTVQLSDPSGTPVSAPVLVTTRADCAQNIARVIFVGVPPGG